MIAEKTRILFQVVFCAVRVFGAASTMPPMSPISKCDFGSLEAGIHKLEELIEERSDAIISDLRVSVRHADYQSLDIKKALGECRNDIDRFMGRNRRDNPPQNVQVSPDFGKQLGDLTREIQLTMSTLRFIDFDWASFKTTLSDILNMTSAIRDKIETDASIQKIFGSPSAQSFTISPESTPKNCKEILQKSPGLPSGIYSVRPDGSKPSFMVFCDMKVQDGGWLTIHSRYEGNQDFFLDWQDYKVGFGNIAGEFWLGLDKIYQLTGNQLNELLVEIVSPEKITSMAYYSYFSIGSEEEGYALKVLGGYKGNAGDALSYQAGSKFSTKDKDQDSWIEGNCAMSHNGAWWYKACDRSNLNGRYIPGPQPDQFLFQSMYWGESASPQVGLLEARMLIRPRDDPYTMLTPDSA